MKKPTHESKMPKPSVFSCRRMALLLCSLAIAGCEKPAILQPPVFDMTRLNQDGSVNDGKDFAKQPWACVLDNKSGMVWEVKGTEPGLHNINNTYSWYDPNPDSNGGNAGKANGGTCAGSNCDTDAYIKAVNAEKLCGYTDWYMPSRYEMGIIINPAVFYPGPTLPKEFFPESLPGKYWTDTTFRTNRASAWAWRLDHGQEYVGDKIDALSVRLVHATVLPGKQAKKRPSGD